MKWIVLSTLVSLVAATARTKPPPGCIVVNKNPQSGQFSTVQAAVDSLSITDNGKQCIFIYQGTYQEQVYICERNAQLTIYGYTTDASSYQANNVTIVYGLSQDQVSENDLTATLRAHNAGLSVYNINLENTRGPGRQALAISATNDQQAYYGVKFISHQDTVLANTGHQVYAHCYIDGAVDFIFGQTARAWFQSVDIRVKGQGFITANGRDSEKNDGYYVINRSTISAADGVNLPAGSTYLGRPWRNYARVVFQNTVMSNVVNPAGWSTWSDPTPNTENVFYREYRNSGPGASGTRASYSGTLSASIPISLILGSGWTKWVDAGYIS